MFEMMINDPAIKHSGKDDWYCGFRICKAEINGKRVYGVILRGYYGMDQKVAWYPRLKDARTRIGLDILQDAIVYKHESGMYVSEDEIERYYALCKNIGVEPLRIIYE